jgi:hypothetical protein
MKKLVKILAGLAVGLVAVLLVVVLTLPLTINPIVKTAASVGGPKVLGVPVSIGNVSLSPLSGRLTITKLSVGNPKGFSDKPSFAVDQVDVGLNLRSLLSDTIIVKKIRVDAPAISYESKDGQSNFDTLLSSAKKSESEEKAKAPADKKDKKAGKKVVIEEFSLNGAKVSYSSVVTFGKPVTVPLPTITLRDIGKSSDGVSPVEAVTEVVNAIVSGLSKAVMELASQTSDAVKGILKSGSSTLGDAASGTTNVLKDAGQAVEDAAKSLKKLFK